MKKLRIGIIMVVMIVFLTMVSCISTTQNKVYFDDGDSVQAVLVIPGMKVAKPKAPEKEGYIFLGWCLDDELFDFETVIDKDYTLKAKWEEVKEEYFTVIFSNKGENREVLVLASNKVSEDKIEDEEFLGWYYNDELFDFNEVITENITLIAKYKEESEKFTVNIYNKDNEIFWTKDYEAGQSIEFPTEYPVYKGYEFVGLDKDDVVVNSDLEIMTIYKLIDYEMTFHYSDRDETSTYTIESESLDLMVLYEEGYEFLGWFYEENPLDLTKNVVTIPKGTTGDLDLYPCFKKIEDEYAQGKITFDLDGGSFDEETLNLLKKDYQEKGRFTITKYNEDYWDCWDGNIILVTGDKAPNANYSIRLCIDKENNEYKITKIYESGIVANMNELVSHSYVIVVAENYSLGYKNVKNSGYGLGDKVDFKNIDLETITTGSINGEVVILGVNEEAKGYLLLTSPQTLPVPSKNKYVFLGWQDTTGKIISDYAGFSLIDYPNGLSMLLTAKWEYNGSEADEKFDIVTSKINQYFTDTITKDLNLFTLDEETGCQVSWSSSKPSVIATDGKVTRVIGRDTDVELTATLTYNNVTSKYTYPVKVKMAYKDLSNGGIVAGYNYTSNIPSNATLQACDILYCAFGSAGTNGKITNLTSTGKSASAYMATAHSLGVYVILCVNTSNLAVVAADDNLIKIFVSDVMYAIKTYGFDGIDIDWERPTVATKTNYTKLMKALYEAVKANDSEDLVTTATAGGPWQYPSFDLENSIKYIDYINLMTYDLHTTSKSTYHNALYYSSKGYTLTQCTIDQSIPLYNACNVPNNKIIVGVPFFGRIFSNTDGIGQSANGVTSITYANIVTNYVNKASNDIIVAFDTECQVPYVYDKVNKKFISYDNPKSIGIKAQYVHDKGLAGLMYWQDSQDYNHELVNAMKNNKTVMYWD